MRRVKVTPLDDRDEKHNQFDPLEYKQAMPRHFQPVALLEVGAPISVLSSCAVE